MFLKEAQRSCNYWNRKCAYISPARDNGECVECNRSNREHSTTGWELYWIQHSGRSSFKSTNLIITARKGFWHSMVWHLALLNCPRSLGCQPCRFLFAEGSGKTPADRNRADSFLFIKKKKVTMNSAAYLQPAVWAAEHFGQNARRHSAHRRRLDNKQMLFLCPESCGRLTL